MQERKPSFTNHQRSRDRVNKSSYQLRQVYLVKRTQQKLVRSRLSYEILYKPTFNHKPPLSRKITAYLPKELQNKFPWQTIMEIIKPLYGVAEARLYWFSTYFKYYKEKHNMTTSAYDPCLLISQGEGFSLVGMQIDDTLILCNNAFENKEEEERKNANFIAKLIFNGCILSKQGPILIVMLLEKPMRETPSHRSYPKSTTNQGVLCAATRKRCIYCFYLPT